MAKTTQKDLLKALEAGFASINARMDEMEQRIAALETAPATQKTVQKAKGSSEAGTKVTGWMFDWQSLPERKTLNRNQVAHRAIVKTLKGLKGDDYKARYNELWADWKQFCKTVA